MKARAPAAAARPLPAVLGETLTLRSTPERGRLALEVTYRIRDEASVIGSLIGVDLSDCPLRNFSIEAEGVTVREAIPWLPPRGISYTCRLVGRRSWHGVALRFTFSWDGKDPYVVVLPEGLPRIFVQGWGLHAVPLLPSFDHVELPEGQGVDIAGVGSAPRAAERTNRLCQAVLIHPDSSRPLDSRVAFTPGVEAARSGEELQWLRSAAEECLDRIGTQLGVEPWIRLVLAEPSDMGAARRHPAGACIVGTAALRPRGRGPEADLFPLAAMVARCWWGAGCRVRGDLARELETGVAIAAGFMAWPDFGHSAPTRRLLSTYAAGRRLRRVSDWWSRVRGYARPGLSLALGASIALRAVDEPAVRDVVVALTRKGWGGEVMSAEVLRELGRVGVRFPARFGAIIS